MPRLGDITFFSSVAFEVCLFWRLLRQELRGRYRFLFFYVVFCLLAMDLTLFVIRHTTPSIYPISYWRLELISVLLRFCVIWEIYRHTFPPRLLRERASAVRRAMFYFWISLFSLSTLSWFQAYSTFHSRYLAMECGLDFAQGVLVLGQLLVAKHYGFPMGRNIWGIAVGFGAYLSVSIMNFSLFELDRSLLLYYQTVVSLSFAAMLAMWTWALWTYAPNPRTSIETAEVRSEELDWWARRWEKTLGAVRKVVNP